MSALPSQERPGTSPSSCATNPAGYQVSSLPCSHYIIFHMKIFKTNTILYHPPPISTGSTASLLARACLLWRAFIVNLAGQ